MFTLKPNYECPKKCGYSTYIAEGTVHNEPPKCPKCRVPLVPKVRNTGFR